MSVPLRTSTIQNATRGDYNPCSRCLSHDEGLPPVLRGKVLGLDTPLSRQVGLAVRTGVHLSVRTRVYSNTTFKNKILSQIVDRCSF